MKPSSSKPWWQSRTLRLNALFALLGAAEANFQLLQPVLGEAAYQILLFALVLTNTLIRLRTTQGLTLK